MNLQENINRIKDVMGILNEQSSNDGVLEKLLQIPWLYSIISKFGNQKFINRIHTLTKDNLKKVKQYYINHYSKPETIAKFKNKNNVDIIKKFITTITYMFYSQKGSTFGYVSKLKDASTVYLNVNRLFRNENYNIFSKGSLLYDTILHETAHLIDFKLKSIGETSITPSKGNYQAFSDKDKYVENDTETFARLQRLRELLKLNPKADGNEIKTKLVEFFKSGKITFPNVYVQEADDKLGIIFTPKHNVEQWLKNLWSFYSNMRVNGTQVSDIAALFAKYSYVIRQYPTKIYLDLEKLGTIHTSVVDITKNTDTQLT